MNTIKSREAILSDSPYADPVILALATVPPQTVETPTYGKVKISHASGGGTSFQFEGYSQWMSFDYRGTSSTDYQPSKGPRLQYESRILVREVFAGLKIPLPEIWAAKDDVQKNTSENHTAPA